MNGQGRPILVRAAGLPGQCRGAPTLRGLQLLFVVLFVVLFSFAGHSAIDAQEPSDLFDIRLRIDWGATVPLKWHGQIEMDGKGLIRDPRSLGIGRYVPGNKWFESPQLLRFQSVEATSYDGMDLSVIEAAADAKLVIRVTSREHPEQSKVFEYTIRDLVAGQISEDLFATDDESDLPKGSLVVRRAPGDPLRLRFPNGPMIFGTSKSVPWGIAPSQTGLKPNETYRCVVRLRPARSTKVLHEYETTVSTGNLGLIRDVETEPLRVPEVEGVYTHSVTLYRRSSLTAPFRRREELTSEIQFVALSPSAPKRDEERPWREIVRFDPAEPDDESWLQFPSVPGIPSFQDERTKDNGRTSQIVVDGRNFTRLATGGWIAHPIRTENPGKPHIIEILYLATAPQTLSVALVEPSRSGQGSEVSVENALDVTEPVGRNGMAVRYHRMVVWPRTKSLVLLLANRRPDQTASFGTIRVLSGPAHLPATDAVRLNERRLAAYYEMPVFPEATNVTEELEPGADGFTFDDWVTYYEGARRTIEYLRFAGYNTAVINVYREGSALYPSSLLQPTPQWDTGVFFSSGQDPHHKDVLELLFRLFDRAGLRLIPSYQFSGTLPELEDLRRQGKEVLLVGDGISGRRYNILNSSVQVAVRHVMNELSGRYGWHESFNGVAIQLSPNSLLSLPGFAAPLDNRTLQQFQERMQIQLPMDGDLRTRGRFLHGDPQRRETWLQWRAEEVAKFVGTLADDLQRARSDSILMLLGNELMASPLVRSHVRSVDSQIDSAMLLLGLDADRIREIENVTFLTPQIVRPEIRVSGYGADFDSAVSRSFDSYFTGNDPLQRSLRSPPGVIFYHPTQKAQFPDFDRVNPLGLPSRIELITQVSPSGEENRRRFAQSLARADMQVIVDGGRSPLMGQEESLRPLIQAYRDLPDKPFRLVKPNSLSGTQPVVIRKLVMGDKFYFYIVNDSPWPLRLHVEMTNVQVDNFRVLGNRNVPLPRRVSGTTNWKIELEPYDLLAVEHIGNDLKIDQWHVTLPPYVVGELTQQLRELNLRADTARRERAWLLNPGFEQKRAAGSVPGWNVREGVGLTASLVATGHTGQFSMRLSRRPMADDLWIDSNAFASPVTGNLFVSVWLRVADQANQPPLRVVIFGDNDFYRMLPIGAGEGVQPLETKWKQFLFQFHDIPVDRVKELHIGFDMMGAGKVFIDDIQVYDLYLNSAQRNKLKLRSNQLGDRLASPRLDVSDCHRFLNEYWPKYLQRHMSVAGPKDRVATKPTEDVVPKRSTSGPMNALQKVRDVLPSFNFGGSQRE